MSEKIGHIIEDIKGIVESSTRKATSGPRK